MHRRGRIIVPVIVAAILVIGLGARTYVRSSRTSDAAVAASGTIEARQVSVASKIPGRIERLHADEGDAVQAGAAIVTIEGREVAAQVDQARAAVDAAQARVAQVRAALALQISQVDAQTAQAEAALDAARTREQQAEETQTLSSAQSSLAVQQAESALAAATENSKVAKTTLDRASADLARTEALFRDGAVSGQQIEAARAAFAAAQAQHAASNNLVAQAEAGLRLARENLRQNRIREGEVAATRSLVRQAEAALRVARAGRELIAQRRADILAAEAQVRQAQASLRYLLTQQENLIITAPISGIVTSRQASEGEVVAAGAPIVTLADLSEVWVRLYVPLPKLGLIAVGQRVEVTTDALPGRVFPGTVTEISQQAEFTPGNIQTREERVKLVFAVKVTLPNPGAVLKPGMPADAAIVTR